MICDRGKPFGRRSHAAFAAESPFAWSSATPGHDETDKQAGMLTTTKDNTSETSGHIHKLQKTRNNKGACGKAASVDLHRLGAQAGVYKQLIPQLSERTVGKPMQHDHDMAACNTHVYISVFE